MGKALAAVLPNQGNLYDYVEVVGRNVPLKANHCRLSRFLQRRVRALKSSKWCLSRDKIKPQPALEALTC